MCPTAALEAMNNAPRSTPALRIQTDAPARTTRTTPRITSSFTLLDTAAKQ
jgi:hypothetical protein